MALRHREPYLYHCYSAHRSARPFDQITDRDVMNMNLLLESGHLVKSKTPMGLDVDTLIATSISLRALNLVTALNYPRAESLTDLIHYTVHRFMFVGFLKKADLMPS